MSGEVILEESVDMGKDARGQDHNHPQSMKLLTQTAEETKDTRGTHEVVVNQNIQKSSGQIAQDEKIAGQMVQAGQSGSLAASQQVEANKSSNHKEGLEEEPLKDAPKAAGGATGGGPRAQGRQYEDVIKEEVINRRQAELGGLSGGYVGVNSRVIEPVDEPPHRLTFGEWSSRTYQQLIDFTSKTTKALRPSMDNISHLWKKVKWPKAGGGEV